MEGFGISFGTKIGNIVSVFLYVLPHFIGIIQLKKYLYKPVKIKALLNYSVNFKCYQTITTT